MPRGPKRDADEPAFKDAGRWDIRARYSDTRAGAGSGNRALQAVQRVATLGHAITVERGLLSCEPALAVLAPIVRSGVLR
jgi:hypothetical protein